jgi:hypothetical protein
MAPRVGYQVVFEEHKIQVDAQSIARFTTRPLGLTIAPYGPSRPAVDRNGQQKFRKDFVVKGAKRRLRRSETLDNKILSKHGRPLRSTAFSDPKATRYVMPAKAGIQ